MKRIVAKTGKYESGGEEKSEWTRLGVILSNDNGEYVLLDPSVSLAGVALKQRALAVSEKKKPRDGVIASVFTDDEKKSSGGGKADHASAAAGDEEEDLPF